ncbi:MAG: DUF3592 domain-containing protein [Burkholderiales bacterium]|nr:DUF3592 domain-containing protein [Burkholderiales bacterium]
MTPFSSWPVAAGLIFIAMGVAFMRASWRKYRAWPRVEGTVVALVRQTVVRSPEIEYRDPAGGVHRVVSRMPYPQRLAVGARVEVAVNPDDPADAERVNLVTALVMPALMLAFGALVTVFAVARLA